MNEDTEILGRYWAYTTWRPRRLVESMEGECYPKRAVTMKKVWMDMDISESLKWTYFSHCSTGSLIPRKERAAAVDIGWTVLPNEDA